MAQKRKRPTWDARSFPVRSAGPIVKPPLELLAAKAWPVGDQWLVLFQLLEDFDPDHLLRAYDFARAAEEACRALRDPARPPRFFLGYHHKTGGLSEIVFTVFAPLRPHRRVFGDPITHSLCGWVKFARLIDDPALIP